MEEITRLLPKKKGDPKLVKFEKNELLMADALLDLLSFIKKNMRHERND